MLRKVLLRMGGMSDAAWYIFRSGMQLCLTLLACALLLTTADPASWGYSRAYHTANAMFDAAEAVLLLAAQLPVIAEDQQSRR